MQALIGISKHIVIFEVLLQRPLRQEADQALGIYIEYECSLIL